MAREYKLKPLVNSRITPQQQEAFDRLNRDPFLSFKDYGDSIGAERRTVYARYHRACYKLGVEPIKRKRNPLVEDAMVEPDGSISHPALAEGPAHKKRKPRKNANEVRRSAVMPAVGEDQNKLVDAIYALSNPQLESVAHAARELGLKQGPLRNLLKKLERMGSPVTRVVEDVRLDYLGKLYGDRAKEVAESISPADIAAAGLKDKAVTIGILTQNKMLVEGKPTQIMEIDDRRHINELMQEFVRVAKYRGVDFTIEDGKANVEIQQPRIDRSRGRTKEEIEEAELAP